jgi:hypothetical protein
MEIKAEEDLPIGTIINNGIHTHKIIGRPMENIFISRKNGFKMIRIYKLQNLDTNEVIDLESITGLYKGPLLKKGGGRRRTHKRSKKARKSRKSHRHH